MAKKKTAETPANTSSPAKPRARRTSKPAEPAAAPIDVAGVSNVEPPASASDTSGAGSGGRTPSRAEIAEAAYHRYLKRGVGSEGSEFEDWIEAERELRKKPR